MINLPTLEQAKRLKELGIEHRLEYGDWAIHNLGENVEVINWPPRPIHQEYYLWLPRLDQIMAEIERLVPGALIRFEAITPTDYGLVANAYRRVNMQPYESYNFIAVGPGPNNTQAAAAALIKILEAKTNAKV